MTNSSDATCPACASRSIQAVPIERRNIAKAVFTQYFLGVAGGIAASSTIVIQAVCLACGCQWFPGTNQEVEIRALSGQLGRAAQEEAHVRFVRGSKSAAFGWVAVLVLFFAALLALAIALGLNGIS